MGFASYSIAITGMRVSERGLNVTGHNIANITTPGYSKQQLITNDLRYIELPGIGVNGIGVDIDELRQLRDNFLDYNYRKETSTLNYWDIKNKNLQEIQTILDEPLGKGLQEAMNQFWEGWQELAKEPDNLTIRALLRQKANVMINAFNHVGEQLRKLQLDINKEITARVVEINSIAKQIAELNMKIKANELTGDNANDFRDKRNLLLDRLSKIVDIEFEETADYLLNVKIGSIPIVFGVTCQEMIVKENIPGSSYLSPAWKNTGELVKIKSGELKGLMEVRGEYAFGGIGSPSDGSPDGVVNIDESQTIPSIKEKLNEILNVLALNVNAIHRSGYGIDVPPTTGVDFFTTIDPTKPFEMGNIQVNPALFDLNLIAAASSPVKGDGTNAQRIIELKNAKLLGTVTDPLDFNEFYRDTISRLGIHAQEAERMTENQSKLIESIENKKELVSGVSLDEEIANILKYQHAYQANVRVLNTIDAMLDKIINGMIK